MLVLALHPHQFYKTRKREDEVLEKLAENPDVEVDDYLAYIYQVSPLCPLPYSFLTDCKILQSERGINSIFTILRF